MTYLFMDFRDVSAEDAAALREEVRELIGPELPNKVLALSDGADLGPEWLKAAKDNFGRLAPGAARVAVVSTARAHRAMIAAMNFRAGEKRMAAFDDEPSAVEWLLRP